MSLGDIFGEHPRRPDHPDMRKITHVILIHDGKTEDPEFDFPAHIAEIIDPAVLRHVATQRALRVAPDDVPLQLMLASAWIDAFITGVRWQQAQEKDS